MKIFISWSGDRSKHIADTFRWWLPNVIQAVDPFVSTQDIEKGTRGNIAISDNLEKANVGIICLSPENQHKPWILFEVGALSKLQDAHVCTFLYEMMYTDVIPPLSTFQHTENAQAEIHSLCRTINSKLPPERRLAADRLSDAFETWYPKFSARMKEVPAKPAEEKAVEAREVRTSDSKIDEMLVLLRRLASNSEFEAIQRNSFEYIPIASKTVRPTQTFGPTLTAYPFTPTGHVPDVPGFLRWVSQDKFFNATVDYCRDKDYYVQAEKKGLVQLRDGLVVLTPNGEEYLRSLFPADYT